METSLAKVEEEIRTIVVTEENIIPFIVPGRLLEIEGFGWGIAVNAQKSRINAKMN